MPGPGSAAFLGAGQARNHVVHRQMSQIVIRKIDRDFAPDDLRVGYELVDIVDGRRRDFRAFEDFHILGKGARRDKCDDRGLA